MVKVDYVLVNKLGFWKTIFKDPAPTLAAFFRMRFLDYTTSIPTEGETYPSEWINFDVKIVEVYD